MNILPVLDLLNGVVVRGVAGQRDSYQPVASDLISSADPLDIARAFRDKLGLNALYVADLDAIIHRRPNLAIYKSLVADGFEIMLDAGLTNLEQAEDAFSIGVSHIIAGLETIPGPQLLKSLCENFGSERVVFSLDLKEGKPLGETSNWGTKDPREIGRRVINAGVRQIIVLDLSQVGVGQGVPTESLCRQLRQDNPGMRLITGGGIRNAADLVAIMSWQVDDVLVASALHDGRIGRNDIDAVCDSA